MVIQHHFFALNTSAAVTVLSQVSDTCLSCALLKKFPFSPASPSSDDPPKVVGMSFVANIKRMQLTIHPTETSVGCITSYTVSCLVPNKEWYPLWCPCPIGHWSTPPWWSPSSHPCRPCTMFHFTEKHACHTMPGQLNQSWSYQNTNKNAIPEGAVLELEEELLC